MEKGLYTKDLTKVDNILRDVTLISGDGELLDTNNIVCDIVNALEKKKSVKKTSNTMTDNLGSFNWLYYKELLNQELAQQFKFRLLFLSTYINYDNQLVYDNGKIIDDKGIEKLLNVSKREFIKTKQAIQELLYKKDGIYIISSKIFKRGKLWGINDNKDITKIFRLGLRELYKNTLPREHKNIFNIFKLIEHTNKRSNVLTILDHINILDMEAIKPLNDKELKDLLGVKSLNKILEFTINGVPVLGKFLVLKKSCWIVNPNMYYSSSYLNNSDLEYLMRLFNMLSKK